MACVINLVISLCLMAALEPVDAVEEDGDDDDKNTSVSKTSALSLARRTLRISVLGVALAAFVAVSCANAVLQGRERGDGGGRVSIFSHKFYLLLYHIQRF